MAWWFLNVHVQSCLQAFSQAARVEHNCRRANKPHCFGEALVGQHLRRHVADRPLRDSNGMAIGHLFSGDTWTPFQLKC